MIQIELPFSLKLTVPPTPLVCLKDLFTLKIPRVETATDFFVVKDEVCGAEGGW